MIQTSRRSILGGVVAAALSPKGRGADGESYGAGLIGIGNRGSLLLKTLLAEPRAKVTALCDNKPDRLDRAATLAARDKPATTSDYRRLLERADVQAVVIASPCDLHVEMAIAALRAGKHVYCEKPIGITPQSVAELVRVARSARTLFMAGQQRHSDMGLRQVVSKIHEGIAGKIRMIKAQRHASADFAADGSSADWVFDARRSGDVIVEQAIHNLDVCNWVLQNHPERAAGFGGALMSPNQPPGRSITDGYTVSFDYPGGAKVSFTQVAFHPRELPFGGEQTYVYGTAGAVALESGTFYPKDPQATKVLLGERKRENREGRHIALFFDCIRSGAKPETDVVLGATAALTAILGREAMYRQKVMTWQELGVDI